MKRFLVLAATLALLMSSDSVLGQQDTQDKNSQTDGKQQDRGAKQAGGQGQKGGGREGQGGGGGLFRLLDIDRDGILSAKEIDGAVAALMKLDVNKDGTLDLQELVVRGGGRPGRIRQGGRGSQQDAGASQRRGGGQGKGGQNNRSAEK